jgi:fatty acid desaturase
MISEQLSGEQLRAGVLPTFDEVARARQRLHGKAVFIAATVVLSFGVVLAGGLHVALRVAAFPVLLVSLMMVATSIMHDANHGTFFAGAGERRGAKLANDVVGFASDLLGVSSALWRVKHDVHHAETNVQGIDPDIDQGLIARLAPQQGNADGIGGSTCTCGRSTAF